MLTKVLALVLVVLIGLALGIEIARYVHGAGDASTGMVNIHLVVFTGVLLTVLWVSRAWLARQWTRFTVWLELTLDGLLDFNSLDVGDGLGRISGSTSSAVSGRLSESPRTPTALPQNRHDGGCGACDVQCCDVGAGGTLARRRDNSKLDTIYVLV